LAVANTDNQDPTPSQDDASAGVESFRLIADSIPGLVAIMTAQGEVELVNRQILEYFGRTLEELKRWGTTDAVHPADLPRGSILQAERLPHPDAASPAPQGRHPAIG
jgi:PAS domain-containing protein